MMNSNVNLFSTMNSKMSRSRRWNGRIRQRVHSVNIVLWVSQTQTFLVMQKLRMSTNWVIASHTFHQMKLYMVLIAQSKTLTKRLMSSISQQWQSTQTRSILFSIYRQLEINKFYSHNFKGDSRWITSKISLTRVSITICSPIILTRISKQLDRSKWAKKH